MKKIKKSKKINFKGFSSMLKNGKIVVLKVLVWLNY